MEAKGERVNVVNVFQRVFKASQSRENDETPTLALSHESATEDFNAPGRCIWLFSWARPAYASPSVSMAVEYRIIGADGREYGPVSLVELSEWIEDGRVGHQTMVWRNDEERWLRATERPELRWDLPAPPVLDELEETVAPPSPPATRVLYPAGFWIRGAAFGVDWVITNSLSSLLLSPWQKEIENAMKLTRSYADTMMKNPEAMPMPTETLPPMLTVLATLLVIAGLSMSYYIGFNGKFGRTPGKFLFGLKIVNWDGSRLGYRRAFERYAAELLSMLTLGVGYLQGLFSPSRMALHDVIAKTRVIHAPPAGHEDFEA